MLSLEQSKLYTINLYLKTTPMIYPDIKTFRENLREHFIAPLSDRPRFLGQSALDMRWKKKPPVNIKKYGKLIELAIAMPGFEKEDIDIAIEGDIMVVHAEKEESGENREGDYILKEFETHVKERKFMLAEGLNREKISASYHEGVLRIVFTDVPTEEEVTKTEVVVV